MCALLTRLMVKYLFSFFKALTIIKWLLSTILHPQQIGQTDAKLSMSKEHRLKRRIKPSKCNRKCGGTKENLQSSCAWLTKVQPRKYLVWTSKTSSSSLFSFSSGLLASFMTTHFSLFYPLGAPCGNLWHFVSWEQDVSHGVSIAIWFSLKPNWKIQLTSLIPVT